MIRTSVVSNPDESLDFRLELGWDPADGRGSLGRSYPRTHPGGKRGPRRETRVAKWKSFLINLSNHSILNGNVNQSEGVSNLTALTPRSGAVGPCRLGWVKPRRPKGKE